MAGDNPNFRDPVPWDGVTPREASVRLQAVKSLAQVAVEAERALAPDSRATDRDGDRDPAELYDRLYARYIGPVRQSAKRSSRALRSILAAEKFCEENGLDLPMYIAAQMDALAAWSKTFVPRGRRSPIGFQPTMLMGAKAAARYNQYLRRADRRFHRTDEATVDSPEKRMRETLYESELSVGAYYVAAALAGDPVTWEAACEAARPGFAWYALETRGVSPRREVRQQAVEISQRFDPEWITLVRRAARLYAASAIADRYRSGLSTHIGLRREFTWATFADLLVRVFSGAGSRQRTRTSPSMVSHVPGCLWRA